MQALAVQTGCDCVMTRIFDEQVIDTHRESGPDGLHPSYGRGRPRPLFLGAAPKVILSTMPKGKLLKLYAKHARSIAEADMGRSPDEFVARLHDTRKAGYYVSKGELKSNIAAMAVPLSGNTGHAVGALALVMRLHRLEFMNHDKLRELLRDTAARIAAGALQTGAGA
jgi:DNA-binding IclR family transcriptional regulator